MKLTALEERILTCFAKYDISFTPSQVHREINIWKYGSVKRAFLRLAQKDFLTQPAPHKPYTITKKGIEVLQQFTKFKERI